MRFTALLWVTFLFFACAGPAKLSDPLPKHTIFQVNSRLLGETRTINVWLPEEYASSQDSLPVLYMLDGGIKEDFPHIANTLAELIRAKKIPSLLLVGIENTQRRRDLTGPTEVAKDKEIAPVVGGAPVFRRFLEQELMPEVRKNYRTTKKRGIIGESLAGLFVTETLLLQPSLFDCYIAFDPSLWWNNQYLVQQAPGLLDAMPSEGRVFWFAGSNAADIATNTRQLASVLQARALPALQWHFVDAANETHQTIFRATKVQAMEWALNRAFQ
jgi:hypothetical protein